MASPTAPGFHLAQFFGWLLGSLVGIAPVAAFQIFILLWPAAISSNNAAVITIVLAIVFGSLGGGMGYAFSYWFDEPSSTADARMFRASFLFSLTVSLLLYSVLSFPLLPYIQASPEPRLFFLPAIGFISAFVAACLKGVLNNLWSERENPSAFRPPRFGTNNFDGKNF